MVTKGPAEIELVGGNVALDLANTIEGPRGGEPDIDHVRSWDDLVAWADHAGLVAAADLPRSGDDRGTGDLARSGDDRGTGDLSRSGADREAVLARFFRLRDAVYAIFWAVADGREPDPAALAELAAVHAAELADARLTRHGAHYDYATGLLLTPAQAAIDLLRRGPLDRVKACAECRWLFLDSSRNRSRRWCSMNECGVRWKMQRYRARRATEGR